MAKLTEAVLARNMMRVLEAEGWDVYPEVALGRLLPSNVQRRAGGGFGMASVDLVASKGPLVMIVECKLSFSLQLIEQAAEWTRIAPLVAIAIPFKAMSRHNVMKEQLRELTGLGVYAISENNLQRRCEPKFLRHNLRFVPDIQAVLSEDMKLSTPGASSTWRKTPYQDTMKLVRTYLGAHGPCPMKEVFDWLEGSERRHHYAHAASMKQSLKKSFGVIEPDVAINSDGLLAWDPDACKYGERYVAAVQNAAKNMKPKPKPKPRPKKAPAPVAEPELALGAR